MAAVTNPTPIAASDLADYWFSLQHKAFNRLREAFVASGLKQIDLALRLGRQESQISKWLRGRANVTLRTMSDLARAMGYRLEIHFVRLNTLESANQFFLPQESEAESKWVSGSLESAASLVLIPGGQSESTVVPRVIGQT